MPFKQALSVKKKAWKISFHFWNAQPTVLSMARPPWLWCVAPRASRNALGADGAVADRWGKDTKAVPAITAAAAAVFDIAMVKFLYTATNKKPSPPVSGQNGYHQGDMFAGEEMMNLGFEASQKSRAS